MKITHTIVSKTNGFYYAFPDIVQTNDGALIVAFRESKKHVAEESRLMVSRSYDGGETWKEAEVLDNLCGHMPRISKFPDGRLVMIDDGAPPVQKVCEEPYIQTRLFISEDNGKTFKKTVLSPGTLRDIPDCPTFAPDKIIPLSENDWITMGQVRLGRYEYKHSFAIFVYRSTDGGKTWHVEELSACDLSKRLTEPSMVILPDKRLLTFYRDNENAKPSLWNVGDSRGNNWGELAEAPFCGQRPTAGLLSDGRFLVTYRKTDKPYGTAAWVGSFEQLCDKDGSGEFMIMASEDNIPLGDIGYSGWVEISPGVVYVVYHHADEAEKSYIRGAIIDFNKKENPIR